MARLNTRWDNFRKRGQAWDHFWGDAADAGPGTVYASLTADAIIRRLDQSATLTADAVLRREQSASFTADAVLFRPQSASLTADAVLRREQGASLTADAVILRTQSASFTADAVLADAGGTVSASFTADAVLRREQTASLTADAWIRREQLASLTANAVLFRTQSASFTANARLGGRSFDADAWIKRTQGGSFTANAFITGTVNRSLTANAVIGWAGGFTADARLKRSTSASFSANAWIYRPRADPDGPGEPPGPGNPGDPGYQPGETPLVSIVVAGTDITAYCILKDAQFTMLVNGAIGTCHVVVRDDAHQFNFTAGSEITVEIDGVRKFGGYIMQPKRKLFFPVEDTTDPDRPSRMIVLDGVDYNFLLSKRIVRNKTDPNSVELREWPIGSDDDDVIKYVFDNYTDLPADGVTYAGVTHVGSPNPDKVATVASGGLRFVDAMREINRLISGVFYIDPYKDLHFVDVDTPNAAYGLSDNPGVGQVGYREMTQVESAVNMVNDALVWGAGQGSRRIVFARKTDAASITAHGLWQKGEFTTQMYRQISVNERAQTIVEGTDQSKRGGRDDQESWTVTTFESSFTAGEKVAIESEVFGKSDVVPIRRMTLTFPSKKRPKMELVLSHEIDEPWNIFEFPPFRIGGIPGFDFDFPPIIIGDSFGCPAGFSLIPFDDFNRVRSSGWGVPSIGSSYWFTDGSSADIYADGSFGVAALTSPSGYLSAVFQGDSGLGADIHFRSDFVMYCEFTKGVVVPSPDETASISFSVKRNTGGEQTRSCSLYWSTYSGDPSLLTVLDSSGSSSVEITEPADGEQIHVSWDFTPNGPNRAKVWYGDDPEPSDWMVTRTSSVANPGEWSRFTIGTDQSYISTWKFGYLDFDYTGRECIATLSTLDEFERSVSYAENPPLGTSDSGHEWESGAAGSEVQMSDGYLRLWGMLSGGSSSVQHALTLGPDFDIANLSSLTLFEAKFRVSFVHTTNDATLLGFEVLCDGLLEVDMFITNFGTAGYVRLNGISHFPSLGIPKNDWLTGSWYILRCERTADGGVGMKLWQDGAAEPDDYLDEDPDADLPGPGSTSPGETFINASFDELTSPTGTEIYGQYIDIEYIRANYDGARAAAGPPGDGAVVGGPDRSEQTGNGGATVFTIQPYEPGTTRVFVDGLFQRRGFEYEETDYLTGKITFTTAPEFASKVSILYEVLPV